jgi:hypothetical protein
MAAATAGHRGAHSIRLAMGRKVIFLQAFLL